MTACHSCPHSGQSHQAFLLLYGLKSEGSKLPFLVGCHWFASVGLSVARSLCPFQSARPEHAGQLVPFERLLGLACHSKLHTGQSHHTLWVLPADMSLCVELTDDQGGSKDCSVCCTPFIPTGNRSTYCPNCAARIKREKATARKRKQRLDVTL